MVLVWTLYLSPGMFICMMEPGFWMYFDKSHDQIKMLKLSIRFFFLTGVNIILFSSKHSQFVMSQCYV